MPRMPNSMISVENLTKSFRVPERPTGALARVGSLFRRRYRIVEALEGVSFDLAEGDQKALALTIVSNY